MRGTSDPLEAAHRQAQTLEAARLGSWDWDLTTNAVAWSGQHFLLFGLVSGAVEPSYAVWLGSIHPEDRPQAEAELRRSLELGSPYHSVYRVTWPSGETHWIEGRGCFLRDAAGLPHRMLGLIMNVDSLRTAEVEHERAARLESLGLAAGGIAHDFNNYLASISASLEVARLDPTLGSDAATSLAEALKVVGSAQSLARQLSTFAKGGTLRKTAVDLHDLVTDTVGLCLRGSPVGTEFSIARDLAPILADAAQLQQVLSSLAVNARQALAGSGRLRVSAQNRRLEATDPATGIGPGRFVEVVIEDDGPGIAPELRDRLFTPYFTSKPGGTGLGLATTQAIVRRHGGSISFQPVTPQGARFTVLLPAGDPAPAEPPKRVLPVVAHRRLLLMDDNISLLSSLSRLLRARGYFVETTTSGDECEAAFRRALSSAEPFNAVVVDLTVPGGRGGVETFDVLRALQPGVAVIAMSGYAEVESDDALGRHGFSAVLAKPFKCEALTALLEALPRAE